MIIDSNVITTGGVHGNGPLDVSAGTNPEYSSSSQPFTDDGNETMMFNSTNCRRFE